MSLTTLTILAAANLLFPFPMDALNKPAATVVFDRHGEPLRIVLPADHKLRIPVTLDELPPALIRAVVTSEDRAFWRHPGVNPLAIARAAVANARNHRRVSGASTIPMQIARMAEPKPRTIAGKLQEAVRAVQLTLRTSKHEQLEAYLNMAPYGGNVEGIGAASWVYFGKRPAQLSIGEIAFLTTLPRQPNRFDPLRDHAAATRARNRVLRQLRDHGAFTSAEVAGAMRQPLPRARRRAPFVAPHFCDYAIASSPGNARVFTTLDPHIQQVAEQQVRTRIAALRAHGVEQAAIVVIENDTREVVAMVGSAAYFDVARQGAVNGAVARRSPGSTLKPFLYAKAFDGGGLIPDAILLDIPTDYSGYVAENYDGTYRGAIPARDALIQSLNSTAVRLLAEEGVDEFVTLLRRGGLTTLDRQPSRYGLPLVLGSGEVRLIDLTNLYATLAENGLHKPVRIRRSADQDAPAAVRVFSAPASAMVTEILTELKRPDMPRAWQLTREMPSVAWKTGTSYGHRDAWSVGYSERYAIGVWAGNFDGHGQRGMTGSEFAAPLLFDLFRAIERNASRPQMDMRHDTINVCALSRELPTESCRDRIEVAYISGRTRLHACTMHRPMFVDRRSRQRLTGDCLAADAEKTVATIYPADLVAWWRSQSQPFEELPPLSSSCTEVASDSKPRIVSPDGTTPYRLRRDAPAEFQEILLAAQTSDASRLYWFEDGVLIGSGAPSRRLFLRPRPGEHQLVVVDESGRSDSVTYRVE